MQVVQQVFFKLEAIHEEDVTCIFPLLLMVVLVRSEEGGHLVLLRRGLPHDAHEFIDGSILTGGSPASLCT